MVTGKTSSLVKYASAVANMLVNQQIEQEKTEVLYLHEKRAECCLCYRWNVVPRRFLWFFSHLFFFSWTWTTSQEPYSEINDSIETPYLILKMNFVFLMVRLSIRKHFIWHNIWWMTLNLFWWMKTASFTLCTCVLAWDLAEEKNRNNWIFIVSFCFVTI